MAISAKKQFRAATAAQADAPREEREAFESLQSFDADEAVARNAEAGFSRFREDLAREIAALRGQSVGMGRLDTGFHWDDEGDTVQVLADRLNRDVAGSAMQAAGLEAGVRTNVAGMAADRSTRYHDLLAADRDYETAEDNRRREKKRGLLGGLGTLLGTGVGAFFGGLPGAQAGAAIGGAAGGLFG